MANHGWVKTRKTMDREKILSMFEEMGSSIFKGGMIAEYNDQEQVFVVRLAYGGNLWARKICWLETSRHFEIRHRSGSAFEWWIDTAILNEVAVRFNGTIGDDGVSDKWKGEAGKYNKFSDYLKLHLGHIKNRKMLSWLRCVEYEAAPPEFRRQTRTKKK